MQFVWIATERPLFSLMRWGRNGEGAQLRQ